MYLLVMKLNKEFGFFRSATLFFISTWLFFFSCCHLPFVNTGTCN